MYAFETISRGKLFENSKDIAQKNFNEYLISPSWFNFCKDFDIFELIVSHFEIRILKFYQNRISNISYSLMPHQQREHYEEIWQKYTEEQRFVII